MENEDFARCKVCDFPLPGDPKNPDTCENCTDQEADYQFEKFQEPLRFLEYQF